MKIQWLSVLSKYGYCRQSMPDALTVLSVELDCGGMKYNWRIQKRRRTGVDQPWRLVAAGMCLTPSGAKRAVIRKASKNATEKGNSNAE